MTDETNKIREIEEEIQYLEELLTTTYGEVEQINKSIQIAKDKLRVYTSKKTHD